jgi:sterol desaturase/sphingolipid hydroxylase (fatty acid hydroxylase superfamily)
LRHLLPWRPISFSFHSIGAFPVVGPGLEILAMIFVPLLIHDCWFYWSHRIEHKVPILWEFHKIHHSDEQMNASTWARDHFLQESWRAFFSVFTLGLIVDLHLAEAGKAALYSTTFLIGMSMFYHSAILRHCIWDLLPSWKRRVPCYGPWPRLPSTPFTVIRAIRPARGGRDHAATKERRCDAVTGSGGLDAPE